MYGNKAIDQVRRREVKQHDELKNSRYALPKNSENLTEKQCIKFDLITGANYEISKAWQVRENFKDLFSCGKLFAWTLYNKWAADSKRRKIKEIDKVVETFNNHISGVVNALIMNLSNAMAERLNNKIQELKTVGRGYRTFANYRSAILFFHGGLDLYPLT
jgi:transposase